MTNLECSVRTASMKLCAPAVSTICVSFFYQSHDSRNSSSRGQSSARDAVIGWNLDRRHEIQLPRSVIASWYIPEILYSKVSFLVRFIKWNYSFSQLLSSMDMLQGIMILNMLGVNYIGVRIRKKRSHPVKLIKLLDYNILDWQVLSFLKSTNKRSTSQM